MTLEESSGSPDQIRVNYCSVPITLTELGYNKNRRPKSRSFPGFVDFIHYSLSCHVITECKYTQFSLIMYILFS